MSYCSNEPRPEVAHVGYPRCQCHNCLEAHYQEFPEDRDFQAAREQAMLMTGHAPRSGWPQRNFKK